MTSKKKKTEVPVALSATRLDVDRDVYLVSYDDSKVRGDSVSARFENEDNQKRVSVYTGVNDGQFVVTVGKGQTVRDTVTVSGSSGGEDSGELTLTPA